MSGEERDLRFLVRILGRDRGWLSYTELEVLYDLKRQARAGASLDEYQRRVVEDLAQRAAERRALAVSLSEQEALN